MPIFRIPLTAIGLLWSSVAVHALGFEEIQMRLGVPHLQASIVDASLPSPESVPEFVVIQDAHRNQEVQSRISWIILHGYRQWGLRKVFVEGAFEPVDLRVFHLLNDRERQSVSDHLVRQGTLSGPERAGIQILEKEWRNPPVSPFEVVGMEDVRLYQASLSAYKQVLSDRPKALEQIREFTRLHDHLRLPANHVLRKYLQLISRMVELRLTPNEYDLYKRKQEAVPTSPNLTPALDAAERFYVLADRRSVKFVEESQRKYPASEGPRIIVTGGFHAPLISQLLRQQGKSFVVFTPRATEPSSDDVYERRLLETSCFF